MAGKRCIYWDACIFIAWIRNEVRHDPRDLDGIAYFVGEWEASRLVIVTSTITRTEVLDSSLNAEQAAKFRLLMRRSAIQVEAVTGPVADLSHDLRNFYASPRLTTPDAIHVATAIAADCDTLHTFDGVDPSNKKRCPLLPLGPTIMSKYRLDTLRPHRPQQSQGELPLNPPPKKP